MPIWLFVWSMLSLVSFKNRMFERKNNLILCESRSDTMFSLTLQHNTYDQPIRPEMVKKGFRFVKIKISKVINPGMHFLAFEVYYRPPNMGKILLGSFSLYPADNPGEFIVSAKDIVSPEGDIILTMTSPDKIPTTDSVRVTGKQICFVTS
jgi:hypothetical protein